jgi:nicotinamide riboside transporter PnuC
MKRPRVIGLLVLWFGFLGAVIAWIVHLLIAYALVPVACLLDLEIALYAVSLVTALIALAALLVSWRTWQRAERTDSPEAYAASTSTTRFMGLSGVLLGVLFLGAIFVQTIPIILQNPCEAAGRLFI